MFTCKFGPPISGLLAVETITLPLLYLATEMANRENAYYGSTATDNAVLGALIFMEIGAIVVMILQVKEFCIGTSAIPLSFLGVFLLNFIVSTFFVFGKFQITKCTIFLTDFLHNPIFFERSWRRQSLFCLGLSIFTNSDGIEFQRIHQYKQMVHF